jgi:hypothetical protein
MTEKIPQDSSVEDVGQIDSLNAKVDESLQPAVGVAIHPEVQSIANSVEGATNRIYAYGAIAATLGIVAGLAFATVAARTSPQSAQSNTGSMNPNAVVLAASVKPETPAPADANTPPTDLPAAQAPADLQHRPASPRRTKKKTAVAPGAFAIEGDDELVGFDTSKGVIQTSARKFFLLSAIGSGDASTKWQDVPSNIHYKCDLNASCTLSRNGAAVLYAKLQK